MQLFDLDKDPRECVDCADDPAYADIRAELEAQLMAALNDGDEAFIQDGQLVGVAVDHDAQAGIDVRYSGQRGSHWPPPRAQK